MDTLLSMVQGFFPQLDWAAAARALFVLVAGFLLSRVVNKRLNIPSIHPQHMLLIRRSSSYFVLAVAVAWALRELGMHLSALLGAAGIVTVAIGFAAQTSVSNLIAGLFLMGEQPFVVGDTIKIGETLGEVLSIDLMSVKLRTFDNLMVRIPNESMLKSNVTNYTRFPIRRIDVLVGVAYKEDLSKVKAVLMDVADRNPLCLEEPKPLFIFQGYGDSALNIQFSVWADRLNYFDVRTALHLAVKEAFDKNGIEIPFPHRTLYTGSVTEPFPVRMVTET